MKFFIMQLSTVFSCSLYVRFKRSSQNLSVAVSNVSPSTYLRMTIYERMLTFGETERIQDDRVRSYNIVLSSKLQT